MCPHWARSRWCWASFSLCRGELSWQSWQQWARAWGRMGWRRELRESPACWAMWWEWKDPCTSIMSWICNVSNAFKTKEPSTVPASTLSGCGSQGCPAFQSRSLVKRCLQNSEGQKVMLQEPGPACKMQCVLECKRRWREHKVREKSIIHRLHHPAPANLHSPLPQTPSKQRIMCAFWLESQGGRVKNSNLHDHSNYFLWDTSDIRTHSAASCKN